MPCDNCSICLEPLEGDIRTLTCGHKFHTRCLRQWEQQARHTNCTCPNCRENINVDQPIPHRADNRPPLRRRFGSRNIFMEHNQEIDSINRFMNNMMQAHMFENAIPIDANEFMHHAEARMLRLANNSEIITETDAKILIVLGIIIFLIAILMTLIMMANDTCMCKYKWDHGATSLTVDGWFGGTTTYDRPLLCTNWC